MNIKVTAFTESNKFYNIHEAAHQVIIGKHQLQKYEQRQEKTKNVVVHHGKTQIKLGISTVCSGFCCPHVELSH